MKRLPWLALFFLLLSSASLRAQTEMILIDFGGAASPAPWNNLSNTNNGEIGTLLNNYNLATDISLMVMDSFNGVNTNGTLMPDPALEIPSTASGDSFFGNTVPFGGDLQPEAGIRFAGLDTSKLYTFTIFASRLAGDNRETQYSILGATAEVGWLQVADNQSEAVVFSVFPAPDGTVEILAEPGPNNNNTYGFYYLGALKIEYASEEAIEPALEILSPNGGEFWQVGKPVKINWQTTLPFPTRLEYTVDNGTSWAFIDSVDAFQTQYDWVVPDTPADQCLVRLTADSLSSQSAMPFEISNNTDSCVIVVIGSSTAAGAGASPSDSSWVNRYRANLYRNDTRMQVINLGRGGYTTYHILPTEAPVPDNVAIPIDTARNMTRALSYNPSAVIVNMPSNDAALYISTEGQLTNFQLMADSALERGVPTFICTTQPRNFNNEVQLAIQREVRDSVLAIYGDYAIDFWTGLADSTGMILPEANSGDGVHVNNFGHRILFESVLEKRVDTLCGQIPVVTATEPLPPATQPAIELFPNPFYQTINLRVTTTEAGKVGVQLYGLTGRPLFVHEEVLPTAGTHMLTLRPELSAGSTPAILFARVRLAYSGGSYEDVFTIIRK